MKAEDFKDKMGPNRLAAVNEECARLNARSVVLRLELMQKQLDGYKKELEQTNNRLMQLQNQLQLQAQLRMQVEKRGSGPTKV